MAKPYKYLGIGIMIVALLSGIISSINGLNPTTLGYTSLSLEHSFIYLLIGFMISNIDSPSQDNKEVKNDNWIYSGNYSVTCFCNYFLGISKIYALT